MAHHGTSETIPQAAVRPFWLRGPIQVFSVGSLLAIIVFGWGYSRTGSAALVVPFLNGERLFVEPLVIDLGARSAGEIHELSIDVLNTSIGEISIVGAQKECGCLVVDEFPLTIGAGQRRGLLLKVALPTEQDDFEQRVKFFTDHANRSQFLVVVKARIQLSTAKQQQAVKRKPPHA